MSTLLLYNFILLVSTLFVWIGERTRLSNQERLCMFAAFIVLLLPAAFRYELGIDYFSYQVIFEDIKNYKEPLLGGKVEPGYYFLNWVVAKLGLSFEYFVFVVAVVTYTFLFISYPKQHKTLFHFVLWTTIYFFTFDKLRSILAGSVLLYASMIFLRDKNLYKYFAWVVVASLIHKSALVFLIIPLFGAIKLFDYRLVYQWIFPILLIFIVFFGGEIANHIINSRVIEVLGFSNYVNGWYIKSGSMATGLGIALILFFITYTVFVSVKSARREELLIYSIISLTAISIILSAYIDIFRRMKLLFIIGYPLAAWLLVSKGQGKYRNIFLSVFVLLCFVDFNKSINNGSTDYEITCNGLRISPYVSVFNKEASKRDSYLTQFARRCEAYHAGKSE